MKKKLRFLGIATIAFFLSTNSYAARNMIQIKGSDTLINLVQRLSEEYMDQNPGKIIAVTGGGSGTGIAALINKKCNIANASRLMKAKEISRASAQGVDVKRIVIAMDGLSVIINGNNYVKKLTVDEIGKIFRGEITNWKELGGEDLPITLYGRQSNSGTFVFFRDFVLKADYSQNMNRMNGNAQIVEGIKRDKSGIGYVGVGYIRDAQGINVVKTALKKGGYYASPLNDEDVVTGKYPIVRPLNQYIDMSVINQDVRDFIDFELSYRGQNVVADEGFLSIPDEYKEFNNKVLGS